MGEGWKEEGDSPVDRGLPCSIVEAVEHVEEHRANITVGLEVKNLIRVCLDGLAGVALLECISPTPDNHSDDQKHHQGDLCAHCAAEAWKVEGISEDQRAEDLARPVQYIVQSACTCVEFGEVKVLEVVGVEPIAGEEHGEEEQDVPVGFESFEETIDL